jgi:2,3-bisphosphoglycerate-dependent phosphoglycerate mutase
LLEREAVLTPELILIRHGVTAWNKDRRFQGGIDIPLDEEGERQARLLGDFFKSQPAPDLLIASDLGRAIATAKPIAEHFKLEIQIEPLWRERHYGDFEGKNHSELQAQYPVDFERWRSRALHHSFPGGGESIAVFHERVRTAMNVVRTRFTSDIRRILVLTHGGVLGSVYRIALGLSPDDPIKVPIDNTAINRLFLDGELGAERWAIRSWGELTHLNFPA